jgi:hypothetical protein
MKTDDNEQMRLAHGFNEELTIILNTANLASRLLAPEHPANDAMVELKRSAERCVVLSRKFIRLAC